MKHIKLSKDQVAIVDNDDYEKLHKYTWYVRKDKFDGYYAERWGIKGNRHIHMHREIMNPQSNQQVDHINGDGLDNRKCNLRVCSQSQNQANARLNRKNTSGYKGVTFHKATNKWAAQIQVNNKRIHLGVHVNPKEAAKLYDEAAIKYFGEFAKTNREICSEGLYET